MSAKRPTAFRLTGWDPLLIVSQIISLQAVYYVSLSLAVLLCLLLTGRDISLDYVLSYREIRADTTLGWSIMLAFLINAAAIVTLHAYHLLFTTYYSGHIPTSFMWWALNVLTCTIMTLGGEWACMRKEMEPIALEHGEQRSRPTSTNWEEGESSAPTRKPNILKGKGAAYESVPMDDLNTTGSLLTDAGSLPKEMSTRLTPTRSVTQRNPRLASITSVDTTRRSRGFNAYDSSEVRSPVSATPTSAQNASFSTTIAHQSPFPPVRRSSQQHRKGSTNDLPPIAPPHKYYPTERLQSPLIPPNDPGFSTSQSTSNEEASTGGLVDSPDEIVQPDLALESDQNASMSDFTPRERPVSLIQVRPIQSASSMTENSEVGSTFTLDPLEEDDGEATSASFFALESQKNGFWSESSSPRPRSSSLKFTSAAEEASKSFRRSELQRTPSSPVSKIIIPPPRTSSERAKQHIRPPSPVKQSSSRPPQFAERSFSFRYGAPESIGSTSDKIQRHKTSPHTSPNVEKSFFTQSRHNMSDTTLSNGYNRGPHSPAFASTPSVYPALLSKVAALFRQKIVVSTRIKDNLEYKDSFDGEEAVTIIASILRTSDRNLALLLGRAIDAQKFFHDVNYEHRLRDSANELYRFRDIISVPQRLEKHSRAPSDFSSTPSISELEEDAVTRKEDVDAVGDGNQYLNEAGDLPNGVFTLLTDCYSPTCSRGKLCYSIACPRRLEQRARMEITHEGNLQRSMSRLSIHEQDQRLWSLSAPSDIANSVNSQERKRQEAIYELIYTEKDFVQDLEYVHKFWIEPLLTSDIIPQGRRNNIVQEIFWNIGDVYAVNYELSQDLQRLQSAKAIVDEIGDVMLQHVDGFEPFIWYGAHQKAGRYAFQMERAQNPVFQEFVEATERSPESRKLEINAYLTKPTTRLGRYPLLLGEILKHTSEGHPDRVKIPAVVEKIKNFLESVNLETGKAENRFALALIRDRLAFKPGFETDLKLDDADRELILKGPLKKKGGTASESSELQVFLFDHYLLLTKIKFTNKMEQYKVYKKPIPLQLLSVALPDARDQTRRTSSILSYGRSNTNHSISMKQSITSDQQSGSKAGYPIQINHLGKRGGPPFILYAHTFAARRQWLDKINRQKSNLQGKDNIFEMIPISQKQFQTTINKVNCSATFAIGHTRKTILGTDQGIYHEESTDTNTWKRIIQLEKVSQVEMIEDARLMIVLADKQLRGRKISAHVSFFKVGVCLDKTLVCIVKSTTLSSTIKTLEPIIQTEKKSKTSLSRLLGRNFDTLKVYRELYIPTESTSIHLLKTNLCIGTTKGFEIVDLTSLNTQGLLDPDDESLLFVLKRENIRPISIYRIKNGEFLLCYDEFAFFVDRQGRRTRPNWIINWEGSPTAFALQYPYLIAFEPSLMEIRNVITGSLEQIILGTGIRCLNASSRSNDVIHGVMEDVSFPDYQYVFQIHLVGTYIDSN
ncbi:hypothetical protein BZG36_02413 [Bifiguratus adelaidae]|uniref:DH domain-containing protein n=1 Tax=Bifiguratus adelaidae TaxID=1938954 RepID=A0A261Y1A9_9FUNG|nr:hypothetical protein BZG36_02413 [Bifiguratus adelaidae]